MNILQAAYSAGILISFHSYIEGFRSNSVYREKRGHFVDGVGPFLQGDAIYANDTCTPVENDQYKSCACMVERTKSVVNLNGIIKNCTQSPEGCKVPRFAVSGDDKWDYAYHPCFPFGMFQNSSHFHAGDKACSNSAAARYTTESALICDSLGSQSNFQFKLQTKNDKIVSSLAVLFNNPETSASAFISLVCNRSIPANESVFSFHGIVNSPSTTYYLAIESVCCCPGGCNVTFPIHNKDSSPTKGFLAIIGIIAAVIFLMVIVLIYVKCTKLGKENEERRRLIDPVS